MALFVDVSDGTCSIEAARFIGKLKSDASLEAEIEKLTSENEVSKIVSKLAENIPALFSEKVVERDVESYFVILANLLRTIEDSSLALKIEQQILSSVTVMEEPINIRLQALTQLVNGLGANRLSSLYATALLALIHYGREARRTDFILSKAKGLENVAKYWLSAEHDPSTAAERHGWARQIYAYLAETLQADRNFADAHEYRVQYLSAFATQSEAASPAAQEAAVRTVSLAIAAPSCYQFGPLMDLAPVQALGKTPAASNTHKTFQLLSIFAQGTLAEYTAFQLANKDFLSASIGGTSASDTCERKMRVLTLCSVASRGELTYAQVASAIQCGEDEVEQWVIRAVAAKLVEAKLDQTKRSVSFGYVAQRVFTSAEWKNLASSLGQWKESVSRVLASVRAAKAAGKVAAQAGAEQAVANAAAAPADDAMDTK